MAMEKPNRLPASPLDLRTKFWVSRLKAEHADTKVTSSGSLGTVLILTSVASGQAPLLLLLKKRTNSGASLRVPDCLREGARCTASLQLLLPVASQFGTPHHHASHWKRDCSAWILLLSDLIEQFFWDTT